MNRAKKEAMIREARKPKPPKDIQVENKNIRLRVILLICSLLVAFTAIGIGISEAVSMEPGWYTVEVASQNYHCGGEFVFNYNFGASGNDPDDEEKALKKLYSQLAEDAYTLFYREGQLSGIVPGETVSVAPELYSALERIQKAGNRSIYLAPVYVEYDRLFLCGNEQEAKLYDPQRDPELVEYVRRVAGFASDPAMVDLELLGNNRLTLKVSREYASFAEEYGIEAYLDLGWMRNAFVADYLADALEKAGYTHGFLASYDGYTRNLDDSGVVYSLNLFDRLENDIYIPAVMDYRGPMSIVFWRNYALSEKDRWHYYEFSDGRIASVYLDPADATEKSATDNLVSYSTHNGCAEILLRTAPVYLSDSLDSQALDALTDAGIFSVWFEGTRLQKNDPDLSVRANEDAEGVTYTIQ